MTQRILRTGVNNKKGRKDTSNKSMIIGSDKKNGGVVCHVCLSESSRKYYETQYIFVI